MAPFSEQKVHRRSLLLGLPKQLPGAGIDRDGNVVAIDLTQGDGRNRRQLPPKVGGVDTGFPSVASNPVVDPALSGYRDSCSMPFDLDPIETRILGCLIEKERLTPENYPLSVNALTNAANQSTNREPVVVWEERIIEQGLERLRTKGLVSMIHLSGSRVPKYRHLLPDHFELNPAETALLCTLLLRGPQTPGELRQRADRMHPFAGLEVVEAALVALTAGAFPMVQLLPPRPGQKERRYLQTLSAPAPLEETPSPAAVSPTPLPSPTRRLESLEETVQSLRAELTSLREELAQFRKQFE